MKVFDRFENDPPYLSAYYPEFGDIMPDGNLRIPWSGRLPSKDDKSAGEVIDGTCTIGPEYPHFEEWRAIIIAKTRREKKLRKRFGEPQ